MEQRDVRYAGLPAIAWLMLIALVVLGAGLGLRDPWPADEPRFALIARDMVLSGEWLFPRVAGVLYPDKPPLYFWLIAFFFQLTGSLRIAFLLPSLLAGLGTLWLVHDLGRRLWSARTGLYAAAILLVTLQFTLQAKSAQIDATLTFWTTLGVYGLCRHLLAGPDWRWYVIGCAAAGAGVITKGVGFLPLLVFIPWLLARRGWRNASVIGANWRWWLGPLATLAVIAAWLVPMLVSVALSGEAEYAAYRDNILLKQTAERYADAWHHIKPFWYFLVEVIPLFWLPAVLALPWLASAWKQSLRARDARMLLLLGWVLLVVLFFSLSTGKRGVYVLPAVPAFALACAPFAQMLLARHGVQRAGYIVLALFAALFAGSLLYALVIAPARGAELVEKYEVEPWLLLGLFGASAVAALFAAPRRGMYALSGWFLSVWLIYSLYGYPLLNDMRSPAAMMEKVSAHIGPHAELALVDWKEQLVLHADRPIAHFGYREHDNDREMRDALAWLEDGDNRWLLLPEEAVNECLQASRLVYVDFMHRARWLLASRDAITPGCGSRAVE